MLSSAFHSRRELATLHRAKKHCIFDFFSNKKLRANDACSSSRSSKLSIPHVSIGPWVHISLTVIGCGSLLGYWYPLPIRHLLTPTPHRECGTDRPHLVLRWGHPEVLTIADHPLHPHLGHQLHTRVLYWLLQNLQDPVSFFAYYYDVDKKLLESYWELQRLSGVDQLTSVHRLSSVRRGLSSVHRWK